MQNSRSRATLSNLRNLFTTLCLLMVLLVLVLVCYSTMYSLNSTWLLSVKRLYHPKTTRAQSQSQSRSRSQSQAQTQTRFTEPTVTHSNAATKQAELSCRRSEMTIVSGYFNIGSFRKGSHSTYTLNDYKNWMKPLYHIENALVFFSDDVSTINAVQQARAERKLAECTYVQLLKRSDLWAFSLLPNISDVLKQPGYPKLFPNTVIPEYAAVMHAKIDMMELAIKANPFGSEIVAWMDSGLFRDLQNTQDSILLLPPAEFNKNLVSYNQIDQNVAERTITAIFHSEWFWFVGGGYFFAEPSVMREWCVQYRKFTEYFLRMGLSNSDQQVIYGMYTSEFAKKTDVDKPAVRVFLQRYAPVIPVYVGSWYHLRWLSQDEGRRQMRREAFFDKWASNSTGERTQTWYMRRYLDSVSESGGSKVDSTKINRTAQCDFNVTVVTAFFSFGTIGLPVGVAPGFGYFQSVSDEVWEVRDSGHYSTWLSSLARVRHPLTAYFDCPIMRSRFQQARSDAGLKDCTYTQVIDRDSLWSWKAMPWIHHLLPRHQAYNGSRLRTTMKSKTAEYLSALHSKFAVLELATENNPFETTDFAWLDAAMFRSVSDTRPFVIQRFAIAEEDEVRFDFKWTNATESESVQHESTSLSNSSTLADEPRATSSSPSWTGSRTSAAPEHISHSNNKEEANGKGYEESEPCIHVLSTGFMTGRTNTLHALSRAYKVAAEMTLVNQLVLSEKEVLEALYCQTDLHKATSRRLHGMLPRLHPLTNRTLLHFFNPITTTSTTHPSSSTTSATSNSTHARTTL